jgi:hypothetical protein
MAISAATRSKRERQMTTQLSAVLKSTAGQMLPALCGVLAKARADAAARNIPEAVFLNDRLAPDMFPLVRQVQTAVDMLARGTARLAGLDLLNLPETETSFDELIERARKVAEFVQAADSSAIDASAGRVIPIPMGSETRDMTGSVYLLSFVLPNFYFHTSMAYGILRHNGVVLGKRDFLMAA